MPIIKPDADPELVVRCKRWLDDENHTLLTLDDKRYPSLLREIPGAPPKLFVDGNPDTLVLPQFAIVGSRNATPQAVETAAAFAHHLAHNGFCITSGLAIGIDGAGHRGALDANGQTVAVCATGLDEIYPPRHAGLARDIAARGALVSEFPPGTPVARSRFPKRNRIISGLSVGTLVVEAGPRSGALITARHANEQGREVFAMPGSIHNPLAKGCHRLIREGAKLVETADDIVEELAGALGALSADINQNDITPQAADSASTKPEYQRLLALMGWDPLSVNTLVERSGLTAEEVSSMLLLLELEERVDQLVGGRYLQREKGR